MFVMCLYFSGCHSDWDPNLIVSNENISVIHQTKVSFSSEIFSLWGGGGGGGGQNISYGQSINYHDFYLKYLP